MNIASTSILCHGGNLLSPTPFHVRKFRVYKRPRLKQTCRNLTICSDLNWSFNGLIESFPSLNVLAPVVGLASGATIYLSSKQKSKSENRLCDLGEWILFTSPTPFIRFVLLRCPSITFEGGELMHDVNERLVEEDRPKLCLCLFLENRRNFWTASLPFSCSLLNLVGGGFHC